jgi:hypothetical protein
MIKFHRVPFAIWIGILCLFFASCVSEKAEPTLNSGPTATLVPQPAITQTENSVLFEWAGVPVMPGAISGEQNELGDYSFKTPVSAEDLIAYYELHMPELGWKQRSNIDGGDNNTTLAFQNGTDMVFIRIAALGTGNKVTIHGFKVKGSG